MSLITNTFIFYLFLVTNINFIFTNSNLRVLGVVELIRHGARAPLISFNDIHKNLYFGTRRTQLTINGCRQHLLLGRWIRRRYIECENDKLLSRDINPKEVNIISSPLQRTIFSAASHILGVYPKAIIKLNYHGNEEFRNDDIPPIFDYKLDKRDGMEININVVDNEKDSVFRPNLCRRKGSNKLLKNDFVDKVKFFKIDPKDIKESIEDINKHYGEFFEHSHFNKKNYYTVKTLTILLKVLRPYKYHSRLKFHLKPKTQQTITKAILNRLYGYRINESIPKKLLASHLILLISDFLRNRYQNKISDKLLVLSGHDSNIINLLVNILDKEYLSKKIINSVTSLDDRNFLIPPLASSLLFELIQVKGNDKLWIRIVYNGENITEGFALEVKKLGKYDLLDYNDFNQLLKSRIHDEFENMNCSKTIN